MQQCVRHDPRQAAAVETESEIIYIMLLVTVRLMERNGVVGTLIIT